MKGWIALDIDGTLTEERYTIPLPVTNYLTQLQREGWKILFVTGRAFVFAYAALKDLHFPYLLSLQNGSLTLEMPSKQILSKKYLSKETIPHLEAACEGLHTSLLLYAGYEYSDRCYFQKENFTEDDLAYIEEIQKRETEKWIPVSQFALLHDFPLVKYFGKLTLMQKIKTRLEKTGLFQTSLIKDPFRLAYYLLLTTEKTASKGTALCDVLNRFGKGKLVIAAGDDENDISLLQAADVKIAMPHAPESLRKIADFIAPPTKNMASSMPLKLRYNMKAIDLSLNAGKKRQSSRTGFVHIGDTIPVYENFCYALSLFRHKTTESVLEGKALIEKLLAFQLDDGNFPAYLHEFPKAWDFQLGSKIFPILFHILDGFHTVLPSAYKDSLRHAMKKLILPKASSTPTTAKEWFEHIVLDQLTRKNGSYPIPYHTDLQLFLGPHTTQERFEPEPLPIEYLLAESKGFSPRLLHDHLHQIHSALLFPFSSSREETALPFWQKTPRRIVWKGSAVHSLYLPPDRIYLPDITEIGRDDLFEVLTYCNLSSETNILINGEKGMVFKLGDQISICTPETTLSLSFTLLEGHGSFLGHISRSNRPGQIACQGEHLYDAFDLQIGIRTLRREGPCAIGINIIS